MTAISHLVIHWQMPSVPNTSLPWSFSISTVASNACYTYSYCMASAEPGFTAWCSFPWLLLFIFLKEWHLTTWKHYQVMGELLDELKGPEEQCGTTDTLLHILSALSTDDALFCFCSCRPKVPTDAQALYSQALCWLLTGAQKLHHQILERTREI